MNYIEREMEKTLRLAWQYFPVLTVTGPRQSGKSTLLRHMFPEAVTYSLKDIQIREFALNDPVAFLGQTEKPLFIDEIQKAPDLIEYIQGIVDNHPERKFLLSGSSQFELMKGVSESLAGRSGVYELMPMSFAETSGISSEKDLDTLLFDGFYPAVCSGKNVSKLYYPSYVKTYLEKDVRDLLNIKDMMQFLRFMKLCAARIGSIFNASELSGEVGVDSKTIASWLSVLQASYIIYLLPPYYENISKRLVKSPKLYFCDPGLACYLLDIESPRQLNRDKMRGNIFENFVVMEAVKHRMNAGKDGGVFFYRDSNKNEVDLLVKEEGEITALEIKSSQTYSKSFADTLEKLPGWIKTPVRKRAVVYAGDFENNAGKIDIINYKHLEI
ncbi:MAG: ATP-binding protein [Bacteroidales bacterium]|jgi:predicted AAA+ superfamily ATPase|nr:ATP-binding protein [Bacteroidales bacterium]